MVALAFGCAAPLDEGGDEGFDHEPAGEHEPGQLTQRIKNGNVGWNPGVVALFTGFVRPCSAVYLLANNGESWVLTARHCITQDGKFNGPLKPASALWVTAQDSPGLQPPSVSFRNSVDYWQNVIGIRQYSTSVDLALLRLGGRLTYYNASTGRTQGIGSYYPASQAASEFEYDWLVCAGYGRERNLGLDTEVEDGSTGAGTARWAELWVGDTTPTFVTVHKNSNQQMIVNGDSGGPCWWSHRWGKALVGINMGVDSASNPTQGSLTNVAGDSPYQDWIFSTLGW